MARITRPGTTPAAPQSGATISAGAASQVGAGLGAIGAAVDSAGRAVQSLDPGAGSRAIGQVIESESKQYFEETKRAHQSAVLSNLMNDATLEFMKQKQQRVNTVLDKNGNPTFTSLTQDVGKIGDTLAEKFTKGIQDIEVADMFRSKFKDFTVRQQVSSLGVARTQQIGFARASLDKGLEALNNQAISDDFSNIETYLGQGAEAINNALTTGVISPAERDRKLNEFMTVTKIGSYQNLISSNPAAAESVLSESSETLGISDSQHAKLIKSLEAKVTSDMIEAKKAQAVQDTLRLTRQAQLAQEVETAIETDSLREDELLRLEDQVDPEAFEKLKSKFVDSSIKHAKVRESQDQISSSIAAGRSVKDFSPAVVDKHYDSMVNDLHAQQGQAPSLQQKAQLVTAYKGKVRAFAKEINTSILSGSAEAAADAVSAYTFVRDRGSDALSGNSFTNDAQAVATMAETLNERGGVALTEAVTMAREAIVAGKDDIVLKQRNKEFNKLSAFKADNVRDSLADDVGAEGFFGGNKPVSDESVNTYVSFVRDMYQRTGDEDAARAAAADMMNRTHGLSTINGEETYMFSPPEKMFPELTATQLRESLMNDVAPLLPEGADVNGVKVVPDIQTRGKFFGDKEIVSYAVAVPKDIGGVMVDMPLVGPDGSLIRWMPDASHARSQAAKNRVEIIENAKQEDVNLRARQADKQTLTDIGLFNKGT